MGGLLPVHHAVSSPGAVCSAGDLVKGVVSKVLSGVAGGSDEKKEGEQEGGPNFGNLLSSVTGDKKDEDEGGLDVLKVAKGFLG